MTAPFTLQQTATDLQTFNALFQDFAQSLPDDLWEARTGTREQDWTLQEALIHLVSIATVFNDATEHALQGKPLVVDGLRRREDLRDWNAHQIAEGAHSPAVLVAQFSAQLERAATLAATTPEDQAGKLLYLAVYNRPAPLRHWLDWQLSHAGIIHAAQVTYPTDYAPLWRQYTPDFTHRQLDRFMRHFSWAYWQDYTPNLQAVLNFVVDGEGGGEWHLIAAADGGDVGRGTKPDARFTFRFAEADAMFGVFTARIPMDVAIETGQMDISGGIGGMIEGIELLKRFSASPPKP
jgi:hypothetical protein